MHELPLDHIVIIARDHEASLRFYDVARVIEFDDGDHAVFLRDPDGVRIEVTCYAPR